MKVYMVIPALSWSQGTDRIENIFDGASAQMATVQEGVRNNASRK
jgi:hypothetical protein